MIELVVVALLVLAALLVVTIIVNNSHTAASAGWAELSKVQREVRHYQSARIAVLEDKLMSHGWHDYANLSQVPNEVDKAGWADLNGLGNPAFGLTREEVEEDLARANGSDLEGDNYEPTIG